MLAYVSGRFTALFPAHGVTIFKFFSQLLIIKVSSEPLICFPETKKIKPCSHRATHDRCFPPPLLSQRLSKGNNQTMTLPKTFSLCFERLLIPQTSRPQHTHTNRGVNIQHIHKHSPVLHQIWTVSQLLEMWQVRQALDMQASALWLISTAQLCRAIAAWLARQKKLFFFLFLCKFSSFSLCLTSQFDSSWASLWLHCS